MRALFFFAVMLGSAAAKGQVDCDRIRKNALSCLACNIYHEARGESRAGQLMVGLVTANRVRSERFPETFCAVVWEPNQFSWTHDGRSDVVDDEATWLGALMVARFILDAFQANESVSVDGMVAKATHYHNLSVRPAWSRSFANSRRVGNHIFYFN